MIDASVFLVGAMVAGGLLGAVQRIVARVMRGGE
jgi:hypothetical protein